MKKRIISLFVLISCMASAAYSQAVDRNSAKSVVLNDLKCTPKDTKVNMKNVLGAIADAVVSNQVTEDQSKYQESVRANVLKGMSQVRRISITDGMGQAQADWLVDGTISNISTTTKVEEHKDNKGKTHRETYYKALGSSAKGVGRDAHFGVYSIKTVAGREARKQVGKIKITDVQGDDVSLCKVQSGGKDIKAAIDAGETLLVVSLD